MKAIRVLKFVANRKTPVTAKMVAEHFAIAQSTAATYLRTLYEQGHLTKQQIGKQVIWDTMAVPDDDSDIQPSRSPAIEPPRPVSAYKTSYPHIRGYDD